MKNPSIAPASSHDRALRVLVLCLDGLIVLLSMGCAWALHAGLRSIPALQVRVGLREPPSFDEYALLLYLTLPVFLALVAWFGLHGWLERGITRGRILAGLFKVHFAFFAGITLLLFLTQTVINRSILVTFLVCTFVLQFTARELLGRWQRFQHASGHTRARILLVGDSSRAMQELVERSQRAAFPPEIIGCLTDAQVQPQSLVVGSRGSALSTLVPQRGHLTDLARILHHEPVDRVLFFPPLNQTLQVREALALCEELGVPAGLAVDLTPHSAVRPRIEFLYGRPFVDFELAPRAPAPLMLKHAFDVVAAALGLLVLSPLLLVVSLCILVSMGRPVFFVQERAGTRGRSFRMFKFRTMVVDAEARKASLRDQNIMGGPVFKLRNDPRVTRLGQLLRTTSIDELPQLFNVLAGQMSLVGPRPLPRAEQESIYGWHRRRLSMKPGITGLWQVSGRNSIPFEQWMELDLEYVDNWSWRGDLRILLRTIVVLLQRRGAH